MHLLISEVLDSFEKAKTKQEKVQILKRHETPVLRGLMRINFDMGVVMHLPEGEPPYKKVADIPLGEQHTKLEAEYRRFYIWLDPKINISKRKKEQLFIEMLESLHITEAEIIILAKDKKLQQKFKSLKEEIVREAYPNTLPPKSISKNGGENAAV